MNKRHLAVTVVAVLVLSSSTIASAEGGSHRKSGEHKHKNIHSIAPIALSSNVGVLTIDTSTAVPSFTFDTGTVIPHIDFDTSTATPHFDDELGISEDGQGEDDFLSAGNSLPPVVPSTPPAAPSWITKPHAKSNDDNRDHSEQSSEDSQD